MKYVLVGLMVLCMGYAAVESDNPQTYTVQTGWTIEKAALETQWNAMSNLEKQDLLPTLEERTEQLVPQLPENQYSAEEGQWVGHRANIQKAYDAYVNDPSGWNYAELCTALDRAEALMTCVNRQETLPHNPPDQGGSTFWNQKPGRQEFPLIAEGWDLGYVNLSTQMDDHLPSVASYQNYVWVSVQVGSPDTMVLYNSDDYGNTWAQWHFAGSSTPRVPFDLAVDPGTPLLFATYLYDANDIWVRIWDDFADSSSWTLHEVEGTTDLCSQPHLSIEHQYTDHRICVAYYNTVSDHIIIAQSTDHGVTWSTTHTTTWTTTSFPKLKGCQGASSATTDRFYFVGQKNATTITVFESTSGMSGSWTETDYVHAQTLDAVDISASHNSDEKSAVVAFTYQWSATDFNVRVLFRPDGNTTWVSQLVDGDGLMDKTPVISCDGEYALNTTGSDYYHLSFYKDHNGDDYYTPMGLKSANDSAAMDNWLINTSYLEDVGGNLCDSIATIFDYGRPSGYYQIDMTTIWNAAFSQWFPAIAWIRDYGTEADARLSFLDEAYGIAEMPGKNAVPAIVTVQPNPATTNVLLNYGVNQTGNVTVSLFDAAGRLVKNLLDANQGVGNHTLSIKTDQLPGGVYFVRVETETGTSSTSVTVVK
ncbi:T9SS type A sorting domain-containing protein [candidate division WOR-3 bacterium]|nr:T9SS type A sorting domain-containing protein [candidate division WOR-3 bacterium]